MNEREKETSGYWEGGAIGGFNFYPLNLARAALLQGAETDAEGKGLKITSADRTIVAMAIYNLVDLDADNHPADFEKLKARAVDKGLGRLTMAEVDQFSKGFSQDVNALLASASEALE